MPTEADIMSIDTCATCKTDFVVIYKRGRRKSPLQRNSRETWLATTMG